MCDLVISYDFVFQFFEIDMRDLVIVYDEASQPAQVVADPPVHNSRINDAIIFMRVLSYPPHLLN